MNPMIKLLDCTLRDGAYIVDSNFGAPAIKGILHKLQEARIDIIECGWLKNSLHSEGSSFFHVPSDIEPYFIHRDPDTTYVAMIDWNRYDISLLPECDGHSLDAIRVVFPLEHMDEGITVGINIAKKGYQVFFQAANTLAYNDDDLIRLADRINEAKPVALSIVDTFGAMYADDLDHIVQTLHRHLDPEIMLAFHSHNNQQLSFALSMQFVETMLKLNRPCMVDGTLCGMGRGAGNTPTELLVSYLNRKHHTGYDINAVMDTIDMYMTYFQEHFSWGYSTPYFIAGLYCCHVNNIAYLLNNHRTNARDMRNVINALSAEDRRKYDYDLLERTYMETLAHKIDHSEAISTLRQKLVSQKILLIAPGRSILKEKEKIHSFIEKESPLIIMVNALNPEYQGDYFFVVNSARYEYARQIYPEQFHSTPRIVLSNIKATTDCEDEYLINFNSIIKRGWPHFDNSVITCLRFLDYLGISDVTIAGFDGFGNVYNESYADISLPTLNPNGHWEELNEEIKDMYHDVIASKRSLQNIVFLTDSIYQENNTFESEN